MKSGKNNNSGRVQEREGSQAVSINVAMETGSLGSGAMDSEQFNKLGDRPVSTELKDLWDYYLTLVDKENTVPLRRDFDPLKVKNLLSRLWIMIWEDDQLIVRLCGTKEVERMKHEPTGHNWLSYFCADGHDELGRLLKSFLSSPGALTGQIDEALPSGIVRTLDMLMLPFCKNEGDHGFAFMALAETPDRRISAASTEVPCLAMNNVEILDIGFGSQSVGDRLSRWSHHCA